MCRELEVDTEGQRKRRRGGGYVLVPPWMVRQQWGGRKEAEGDREG